MVSAAPTWAASARAPGPRGAQYGPLYLWLPRGHLLGHGVDQQRAALALGHLRVERRHRACRGVEVLGLARSA